MVASPNPIAITGLGACCPLGSDVATSWQTFQDGGSSIQRIPENWGNDLPSQVAGITDADIHSLLKPHIARRLDRSTQLALLASSEAWHHAGTPPTPSERLAVVFGTGIGGVSSGGAQFQLLQEQGPRKVNPLTVPMVMPNAVATQVALWLGAQGPVEAPVSACATGADAIAWGAQLLRAGQADRVLVGGCEALVNRFGIAAFGAMQALSPEREDPSQASRPFDQARQGFVMAEGAAALVLEPLSEAKSRGATIHGLLRGQGVSFDAHHITAPHPDGLQAERAMKLAINDADISTDQVSFIKAHATGTPHGDPAEAKALSRLFGEYQPWVIAPKAQTGHLIGGAGALETVLSVLCLREGVLPPQQNCPHPDPSLELPLPRQTEALVSSERFALANAFGFGGKNVALVLSSY